MKYVVFICGGKWQLPWLSFLKSKGHAIILVDPYEDSLCVPHADIHIQCDARDVEFIWSEIQKNYYSIAFVTSDQTDVSTDTVALLSQKLGLKGNDPEVVKRFSNKLQNRLFLESSNLGHYPRFIKAEGIEEIVRFKEKMNKNLIVKPVDAQSSRGIFTLDTLSEEEIKPLFEEAIKFSKANYVIAEEFISGTEFTVEGLCLEGCHTTLAISRKKHFRTGIASELKYPSDLSTETEKELVAFHNKFIEATGLQNAITHTEYIIDEATGEFWLVEAACRGGGSLIPSHIVPWVSGVEVYERFYNTFIGKENPAIENIKTRNAILYFFEFEAGEVKSIKGVEEAKQTEGVLALELEFKVGDVIKSARDDRGRQGYTIILAETEERLKTKLEQVKTLIKVNQ